MRFLLELIPWHKAFPARLPAESLQLLVVLQVDRPELLGFAHLEQTVAFVRPPTRCLLPETKVTSLPRW